ncbi:MAG: type II secretion system inner membrane protein GspF [Deltaproteobacteria bacterium]|nr:type II secretion system inner membrane protein GspF [Deltaproteobacteria bacterium]
MGHFAYTGVDARGKTVRGTVDADDLKGVRQALRRQGVFLDDATPLAQGAVDAKARAVASAAAGAAGGGLAVSAPGLLKILNALKRLASNPSQAVALSTRQLATLVKAGIPLVESLTALLEQLENEELREAYREVRDRVNEGTGFAVALAQHPRMFPGLYISMVAAGEASGTLEAVLMRLADFMEGQVKLKGKIVGALAYPAFMALMGVGIVGMMMVVVVPKVSAIFDDFRQALPWYTAALIGVSNIVANWWWALILLAGLVGYGFSRWKSTPEGAYRWDAFQLRVPVFGELTRMVAISRFTRTLATLLSSGVPLLKAMDIVKNVMENRVLEAVITEATVSIKEGESIAEPLKRSGRFPPMVTQMISVGERSGELEAMLEAVASSYDNAIDARVSVLTSLLEPVMIVVMGSTSGGIAFAILMPLLQLNEFAN